MYGYVHVGIRTGAFSLRLHRSAQMHLASAVTRMFAPPHVTSQVVDQATRQFTQCVFTLTYTLKTITTATTPAELHHSNNDAPLPASPTEFHSIGSFTGSANGAPADRIPAADGYVGMKHHAVDPAVRYGGADYFVVCSHLRATGLAKLRGVQDRFRAEHGRDPTFCLPRVLAPSLNAHSVTGPSAGNGGNHARRWSSSCDGDLSMLPSLAAGCGKAVVVLDDDLLLQPRGVLELFAALAIHFKPGFIEVVTGGQYKNIFSKQLDADLAAFSPTAVAVATNRAITSDAGSEHGQGALAQLETLMEHLDGSAGFVDVIRCLEGVLAQRRAAELARSESYNFRQTLDFLQSHGLMYIDDDDSMYDGDDGEHRDSHSHSRSPTERSKPRQHASGKGAVGAEYRVRMPPELPRASVEMAERIGSGEFGFVHRAMHTPCDPSSATLPYEVAVKTVNATTTVRHIW